MNTKDAPPKTAGPAGAPAASIWLPRKEFLAQVRKLPPEDGDPLHPKHLGQQIGVTTDTIDGAMGRTADPTSDAGPPRAEFVGRAPVVKPVYENLVGVLDPMKVCATCKHFTRDREVSANPQFITFLRREAKFLPGLADGVDPEAPVKTPWFDETQVGRCGMNRTLATSASATCSQWARGSALRLAVGAGRAAVRELRRRGSR